MRSQAIKLLRAGENQVLRPREISARASDAPLLPHAMQRCGNVCFECVAPLCVFSYLMITMMAGLQRLQTASTGASSSVAARLVTSEANGPVDVEFGSFSLRLALTAPRRPSLAAHGLIEYPRCVIGALMMLRLKIASDVGSRRM